MPDVERPLPHLVTFCKAAELGNFSAAARELGITQAAVSQRISSLEKQLRVSLFDRHQARVCLTTAGQQLHAYAHRIRELHREAKQALTGQVSPVTGNLVLGASSIPGEYILPGALSIFRRQFPGIHVRAAVAGSSAVLEMVENGDAHLGLVGMKADRPNLEFRPFAKDELCVVVPAAHPWARRKRVSYKKFASEPLVIREPGSGSRWCLEHALSAASKSPDELRVELELGSNEAIKEAVSKGMGVAVLSELAIRADVASGRLHAIRIEGVTFQRNLFVVFDHRRALPNTACAFLHFVEALPTGGSA